MKNLSIKVKLILIFIFIKIIPLIIVLYIAYEGILKLDSYLNNSTISLFNESKKVILNTANESISDSIKNLDKKSQRSLERLSYEIANNVAQFLYQRDEDLLLLSKMPLDKKTFENFYNIKKRDILIHDKYIYDDKTKTWENPINQNFDDFRKNLKADLKDNEKEFSFVNPIKFKKKEIPIYKEISYFNLEGLEKYKISSINNNLLDVSKKKNTYVSSEDYFEKIKMLKNGDIYVSNVIGEYVSSKVIGTFTKEKTKKAKIDFEPSKQAYAGKENPLGKKFEAIIRFITPVYEEGEKVGYLTLALDHEHIMQFTDTSNPTGINAKQDIADASVGNYAFMWDYEGRNISHARDYFIVGFDKNTGNYEMPWLSKDVAKKFKESKEDITEFLKDYPLFEEQSLSKKPNIEQLKKYGKIGLDCRYLNFAPQCQGWMQVTKDGGYGSFVIFWSNVWKLTTAASIPYFTGQYGTTKRGFGFVTIGANVDEFHSAANETKKNVNKILDEQTLKMKDIVNSNKSEISLFISRLINELSIVTFIMIILVIIIALMLSNYLSKKIEKLLVGTNKFANNELNYRIDVSSDDEIGKLEKSFNSMALEISELIKKEKTLNENLEKKVEEGIQKQREQEQMLIQQSRLASMGEMIGNIAHQWRQPLNALSLLIQNIQFSYEMDELDSEFMKKSVKKANLLTGNMSKTIDDFRNFFKPNKIEESFNINDSINKSVSLVESSFENNNIEMKINYSEKSLVVRGYPNEFSQALVNLLNNAKDAFLESTDEIKSKKLIINSYNNSKYAIVEIIDNAMGIDVEIIEKIFDPYFSTKEEGKGVGIGLYMTKMIIEKNMNGLISVSNLENGVIFTIKLPLEIIDGQEE